MTNACRQGDGRGRLAPRRLFPPDRHSSLGRARGSGGATRRVSRPRCVAEPSLPPPPRSMGALPRPRRPAPAPAAPPRGGRRSGAGNGGASGRAAARLRPPAPRSSPRAAVPSPPPPRAARRVEEAGTPLRGRSVTKGTRGNKPNRGARLATWHGYRFTRDHGREKTKASPRLRPTAWYCL